MAPRWIERARGLVLAGTLAISGPAAGDAPTVLASVGELFRPPLHRYALISPTGRYVAVVFGRRDQESVRIHDTESLMRDEIPPDRPGLSSAWINTLLWVDVDSLIVGYASESSNPRSDPDTTYALIDFDLESEAVAFERLWLRTSGVVVDALSRREDEILFAAEAFPNTVYRVDPHELAEPESSWVARVERGGEGAPRVAATLEEGVAIWLADREGVVRTAVSFAGEPVHRKIWFRDSADAEWTVVRKETNAEDFADLIPLGLTADGKRLLVASALDRDRYGLYEYDPETNAIGRLIYEHPTAEIIDIAWDHAGNELLAAVYLEEGERRYAYLNPADDELRKTIAEAFPGWVVSITGLSVDRRRASLRVSQSDDPGAFWILDLDSRGASEVGRVAPWLDNNRLARTRVFRVEAKDGLEIDAFLTLPPDETEKPPLVVMPHGGPIGIADLRSFSPEIQYLARSGFAVLQVNYRGSGGYGRRFERAGRREWGRGIEDDVDAAVDRVVEEGWVDGDRMCTMGASYGGYSALMTVIRHPDRYRCAASLMGVTDIALLFNLDEVMGGQRRKEAREELVGHPEADYAELRRYSPVYNADKIKVPVYLAHGEWDRTVDLDHMVRMKLALELEKVPMQLYTIPKTRHGFARRDDAIRYWKSLRAFLVRYLDE